MKYLALLLLAPSLALGQGLNFNAPGQAGGGKVLASFPFATAGCYASGAGGVSITRATPATYIDGSGNLQTCASGEYRVAPDGLLVEPQRINYALQSNTMSTGGVATSPWSLASATVTTVAGAPLTGTWAQVTTSASSGRIQQTPTVASSTTQAFSIWAAKASGTGAAGFLFGGGTCAASACTCSRSDGGACSAAISATHFCVVGVTDLGTTPVRIMGNLTCSVAIASSQIQVYPGESGVSTGTTRFTGAQLEVGTYPTSLCVSTSGTCTRDSDQISATVPSVPSNGWCIAGTFKPTSGTWPNALSLWTLGDNYNSANTASSWGNSSLYIVDKDSGVKDLGDYTDPVSPWRIVTCNKAGSLSLAVNGIVVDESATGAGTGILTTPSTTLRFGAQTGGGTISDWYIKGVKVCAAKKPSECK